MDTFEAIFSRQSVSKMSQALVSREIIEKMLESAAQAPNHFRVRPWRFIVIRGDALQRMGDVMAQSLLARQPESTPAALDSERSRPLRAPVIIAVGVDHPTEPKVKEIENVCAAAAAVENMLLAGQALGVATMWRTGPASLDPQIKSFLGLEPSQHLIGFIYIGYPEAPLSAPQRPGYLDRTTWLE